MAPFFEVCPVCADTRRSPVVEFPELTVSRCAGCGLIYKSRQLPGLGHGYEEKFFLGGGAKYLQRWAHRVRKCTRQIQACLEFQPRGQALLDVGCSMGYVLAAAKNLGLAATGLDVSQFAVDACRNADSRRLRRSSGAPAPAADTLPAGLEHVRWAGLAAWTWASRTAHLRRDIQAFVVRPA